MRVLITGGPGSGCTSTAQYLANSLGVMSVDSDAYFHKSTDPPYQEQYSAQERRALIKPALAAEPSWVLSGSVATWKLGSLGLTHSVFLNIGRESRMRRIICREKQRFGEHIADGGYLHREHTDFIQWAGEYETRQNIGRNMTTDYEFATRHCPKYMEIVEDIAFTDVCCKIKTFLRIPQRA